MQPLKLTAKIFYGIGITGIGILQIIVYGFRPLILPVPAENIKDVAFLPPLTGAILVIAGAYISIAKKVKFVALLLGLFLLLFFLIGHLPNRLKYNPDMLGAWTDALKLLSLAGGAFIIAGAFPGKTIPALDKIAPFGNFFLH